MKDKIIEKWVEKHSSLLEEYSKGNVNNEVMQMYRSQMKDILDFISDLKQLNLSTTEEIIDLCKRAFEAGEMHCATEGKIYERSDNFDKWLNNNI